MRRSGEPSSNVIHFDGKKNPEMVPDYRVWAMMFRIFADGVRILPDGVVEHVSKAEASQPPIKTAESNVSSVREAVTVLH